VWSLTIDTIVREAGVVRTTFYLHFRDKQELIETLADEQVRWLETVGQGARTDPELTRDTVRGVLDEITSQWVANHAVLSAIIEFAEYDDRMHARWTAAMRDVAGVALELFRQFWDQSGQTRRIPGAWPRRSRG
jgi:AcrR family transcriptional regulator